jgi:hypothetical protein
MPGLIRAQQPPHALERRVRRQALGLVQDQQTVDGKDLQLSDGGRLPPTA